MNTNVETNSENPDQRRRDRDEEHGFETATLISTRIVKRDELCVKGTENIVNKLKKR